MNSTNPAAKILANQTTGQLMTALLVLDAKGWAGRSADERKAYAWLAEEIEARFPEVDAAMEAWAADLDTELSYAEALLAALPVSAVAAVAA